MRGHRGLGDRNFGRPLECSYWDEPVSRSRNLILTGCMRLARVPETIRHAKVTGRPCPSQLPQLRLFRAFAGMALHAVRPRADSRGSGQPAAWKQRRDPLPCRGLGAGRHRAADLSGLRTAARQEAGAHP